MSFDKDFLKDNEIDYVQMSIEIEENGQIVSESKEKVDIPPTLFLKKEPGSGGAILHMEHAEISYDSTDLSNGTIEIVCKMYNSEDELVEFTYEKVKSRIIIDYSEKDGKLNYDIDYDQPEEYHEQVKARTTIMEIDLKENDIIPRTDDWKLKASVKIPRVHFIKEDGSVYNESSISIYVNPQDEYLMYNQIYEEGILDCDFLYLTEEDILESLEETENKKKISILDNIEGTEDKDILDNVEELEEVLDLDIDIENDNMSMEKLYELSAYIIKTFHPLWYEAKEEISEEGKRVWFHGFETMITGELWNVDLWFFDKETIMNAEIYCDGIVDKTDEAQKKIIISIKEELIKRGLYSFEQYKSIDVYKAVVEEKVRNIGEFFESSKDT